MGAVGIVDQVVSRGADVAGASEFFEVDAVVDDIVAVAKRVVLILTAIGVLDAHALVVGNPSVKAGNALKLDVVVGQAREPGTGYACSTVSKRHIVVSNILAVGALKSISLIS